MYIFDRMILPLSCLCKSDIHYFFLSQCWSQQILLKKNMIGTEINLFCFTTACHLLMILLLFFVGYSYCDLPYVTSYSFVFLILICFTAPGCSVIRVNLLLPKSLKEIIIGVLSRSQGKKIAPQKPREFNHYYFLQACSFFID